MTNADWETLSNQAIMAGACGLLRGLLVPPRRGKLETDQLGALERRRGVAGPALVEQDQVMIEDECIVVRGGDIVRQVVQRGATWTAIEP